MIFRAADAPEAIQAGYFWEEARREAPWGFSADQASVIETLPPIAGRNRYRVFHASGDVRDYSEDQLAPAGMPQPAGTNPLAGEVLLPSTVL